MRRMLPLVILFALFTTGSAWLWLPGRRAQPPALPAPQPPADPAHAHDDHDHDHAHDHGDAHDHDHHDHGPQPAITVPEPAPATQPLNVAPVAVEGSPDDPTRPYIQTMPDGSRIVDRLYTLRGAGTAEEPYEIRWDYLLSAKETYDPGRGQWEPPPRVAMLDGKHVRVRGYLAVPVYARINQRILLTWNMIDACHGIKPIPTEALEVALISPVEMEPHTLSILALRGVLRLDRKLEKGWLMTLYHIENGEVEAIEK